MDLIQVLQPAAREVSVSNFLPFCRNAASLLGLLSWYVQCKEAAGADSWVGLPEQAV